jgi:hypothetical protein
MVYVRKDWNSLTAAERTAYANAVQAMKNITQQNPNDPRGWQYQANVHGVNGSVPPALQPFWAQCQHQSYFFLSWHRMYIYFFEQILRAVSNNPNLTLPYWNYTDTPQIAATRALPQEFRQPNTSANPLYVQQRNSLINQGAAMSASTVAYAGAYAFTNFYSSGTSGGLALAFGGYPTGPTHFGNYNGQLENQPHNVVHVAVGGWMGNPNTAAADPIFWLHHCNIDRLWEGWLALGGGRANPQPGNAQSDHWLKQVFNFHNGSGQPVTMTGAQVVNTARQLNYVYDKLPPKPLTRRRAIRGASFQVVSAASQALAGGTASGGGGAPLTAAVAPDADAGGGVAQLGQDREGGGFRLAAHRQVGIDVGGQGNPFVTQGDALHALVASEEPPPPHPGALGSRAHHPRVVLSLEGLDVEGQPELTYEVYLNPPAPEDATPDSIYYVGNIGIFTHKDDGGDGHGGHAGHEGHGLTNIAFDVTDVVHDLRAQNRWDPQNPNLVFVARGVEPLPAGDGGVSYAAPSAADRSLGDEVASDGEPAHYTVQRVRLLSA